MLVQIQGQKDLKITHVVIDFNGTIALDGCIFPGIKDKLTCLSEIVKVHILTGDSNGTAAKECEGLPVTLHILEKGNLQEMKADFVKRISPNVAVIGNGVNDEFMFREADLSIAILGPEGCATGTLMASHVVVKDISDALDLLLKKHRLVSTLRK